MARPEWPKKLLPGDAVLLEHDEVEINREWLCRRALQAAPFEACGFILSDGTVVEIPNVSLSATNTFEMSSRHLLERIPNPHDVLAIWHTHPGGNPHPSKLDLESIRVGAVQSHWRYLIATKNFVTEWDTKSYMPQDDSFWLRFSV